MRRCLTYRIKVDQDLPSLLHCRISEQVIQFEAFAHLWLQLGYPRSFLPHKPGWPAKNKPGHKHSNTVFLTEAFGNKNYVQAVGNPDVKFKPTNRFKQANLISLGFGFIVKYQLFQLESLVFICTELAIQKSAINPNIHCKTYILMYSGIQGNQTT